MRQTLMRLILISLAIFLICIATSAKPESVWLSCAYTDYDESFNVIFDTGVEPYNVTTGPFRTYVTVDIPTQQTINVTDFDGTDQVVPRVIDISFTIKIIPDSNIPLSDVPNRLHSYYREWPAKHSVLKTTQIDGKEGVLYTEDGLSGPCASYYPYPSMLAIISSGFGGYGVHYSVEAASQEEIDFYVSCLESFLQTLHIEKV